MNSARNGILRAFTSLVTEYSNRNSETGVRQTTAFAFTASAGLLALDLGHRPGQRGQPLVAAQQQRVPLVLLEVPGIAPVINRDRQRRPACRPGSRHPPRKRAVRKASALSSATPPGPARPRASKTRGPACFSTKSARCVCHRAGDATKRIQRLPARMRRAAITEAGQKND